jgi:hypothetical protein
MRGGIRKQPEIPRFQESYSPLRQAPSIARHSNAIQAAPRYNIETANSLSASKLSSQQLLNNNNFYNQQQPLNNYGWNMVSNSPADSQMNYFQPPHFSKKEQLKAFHDRERAPDHFLAHARTENLMARVKAENKADLSSNSTINSTRKAGLDYDLFKDINLEIIKEPG